jgi:nicotinamide riboside kinase
MKLISFTGAQSSGKTTLLNKCRQELPGNWYYVDEVTRYVRARYGEQINEQGSDMTQIMIINTHVENSYLPDILNNPTDNPLPKYDGVILDRCIVDGLVYTEWLYEQGKISEWVVDYARRIYKKIIYKLDYILYTDPAIPLVDDGERSIDVEFRKDIISKFENVFFERDRVIFAHKLHILSGDISTRFNTLKECIL